MRVWIEEIVCSEIYWWERLDSSSCGMLSVVCESCRAEEEFEILKFRGCR